ncbi:MAG: hypothetical protein DMF62_02920 [Acidobacteria bacterium]|nr:MAG: hypothetical protein DMF62_02920 [Acidobacteriota bacterium]
MLIKKLTEGDFPERAFSLSVKSGIAILAALVVAVVVSRVMFPFEAGPAEAFSWVPAQHLLGGENPYSFATTPPYSMAPYGIVYYAILAVGLGFFGPQLWFGRLLAVVAFCVCVWAVGKITRKLTGGGISVWAACLFALALFPGQTWIAVMRSDMFAVAFALAAVYIVFTYEDNESLGPLKIVGMVLLTTAALFTKQTILLPFGIIVLRLIQLSRWRDAIIFLGSFLGLSGLSMLLLNQTSEGGYFWQHFTHAERLPFSFEGFREQVWSLLTQPTTVLAGLFVAICAYKIIFSADRPKFLDRLRSPELLMLFYLCISVTWAAISVSRVGAGANYFLEAAFILSVVCALILANLVQSGRQRPAFALIAVMIFGGIFQLARVSRGEYFRWNALSYFQELSETASRHSGPGSACVSVYASLVIPNGCELHFDDYSEYGNTWAPELANIFEQEVKSGKYAVIIWSENDFFETVPQYRRVQTSNAVPERISPAFIYVRESMTVESGSPP